MSWGARRKFIIEAILVACAVGVIAVVCIAIFYKTPSCNDGIQDQGEQGIDCGGPCPYACNVDETSPSVRFVRAVSPQPGRTDLIAYIDNANSNAELQNAEYTAQFYDASGAFITQESGTVTVPPSTTEPLFIPGFYHGTVPVAQAFLTLEPTSYKWLRVNGKAIEPTPDDIQVQDTKTPKITAVLENPTAETMQDVTVIATVFNTANNAIAASQTVVEQIPPEGTAPIVFTWNEPFPGSPTRVEILPAVSPAPMSL